MKELRSRIKELGIKKSILAEKMGCSQSMLSHWLNETQRMPDDKKKKIYDILSKIEVALALS